MRGALSPPLQRQAPVAPAFPSRWQPIIAPRAAITRPRSRSASGIASRMNSVPHPAAQIRSAARFSSTAQFGTTDADRRGWHWSSNRIDLAPPMCALPHSTRDADGPISRFSGPPSDEAWTKPKGSSMSKLEGKVAVISGGTTGKLSPEHSPATASKYPLQRRATRRDLRPMRRRSVPKSLPRRSRMRSRRTPFFWLSVLNHIRMSRRRSPPGKGRPSST